MSRFGFGGGGPKQPPEIVNQKKLNNIRENSNRRTMSLVADLGKIQEWKILHETNGIPEDDWFKYVQDTVFNERLLYEKICSYGDKCTQTNLDDEEKNASSSSTALDLIKIENALYSNYQNQSTAKVEPNIILQSLNNMRDHLMQLNVEDNIDLGQMKKRVELCIDNKLRRFHEIRSNFDKIYEIDISTQSLLNTKQRNFKPINFQNILYALGKNREYLEQIQDCGHYYLANSKANALKNVIGAQEKINEQTTTKTEEKLNNPQPKSKAKLRDKVVRPGTSQRVVSNQTITHHHHHCQVDDVKPDDIDKDSTAFIYADDKANSNDDETEKDVSEYLSKFQLTTPANPTEEFIGQVQELARDLQLEIDDFSGTNGGTEYFKIDECLTQLMQSLEKISHRDFPNLVPHKARVIKFIFKLQEDLDQKCAN